MNKVYCKNCKWFKAYKYVTCNKVKAVRIVKSNDAYSSDVYKIKDYLPWKKQNKNNDCPHYQRKWWKFWVIEKEKQ